MENEVKSCKECGEPIIDGRSDKIFCNDYCRYDYNNENGLRNRLYQLFKKHNGIIISYIDTEINSISDKMDNIRIELNRVNHGSENNYDAVFEEFMLREKLKVLKKIKETLFLKNSPTKQAS